MMGSVVDQVVVDGWLVAGEASKGHLDCGPLLVLKMRSRVLTCQSEDLASDSSWAFRWDTPEVTGSTYVC